MKRFLTVLILIIIVWPTYLYINVVDQNKVALNNFRVNKTVPLHNRLNRIVDIRISGIETELDQYNKKINYGLGQIQDLYTRTSTLSNTSKQSVEVVVSTIEIIAPKVIPSVVHVMCPEWQGSGFVVGPRLIATARHVVEGVTDFVITTHDGHKLRVTRAISFKNRDVGFIWIDDLRCVSEVENELECSKIKHEVKLQVLELGSIKECNLGQPVFAIGSPYGKVNFNHLSSGIVSSLDRSWDELGEDYGWEIGWTTTVAGHLGNSGCPVFTLDGRVRGILVGGFSPVLVIAMPVDLFLDHLDEVTLLFEMDQFRKEKAISQIIEWSYTSKGN